MFLHHEALIDTTDYTIDQETKQKLLDIYGQNLAVCNYKTYPAQNDRLFCSTIPRDSRGLVTLPNQGPWVVGKTFPDRQEKFREIPAMLGYPKMCTLDADYRPLNPLWQDMLKRPDIGGVVGKGFYYRWGANYTADSAVTIKNTDGQTYILLIQRSDTGEWALPGGFVDKNEHSYAAAIRELREESGIEINAHTATAEKLYSGIVLDVRSTLHAWSETTLWHFGIESDTLPEVNGQDDAINARWFEVNELPLDLYGSHPLLLDMVINSRVLETTNHQADEQFPL